jgi:RNA polymerase sporulation-specific sigma factor
MDTRTLIHQAHRGDKASRDKILIENTGLIWSIVKRFLNRGYDGEDLFQIGCIGMLKAIDRFDENFNVAFSTYAVPMIAGEIRRFLRDDGIIKISRKIKEHQFKIITETEKFRNKNQREPTMEELAKQCELTKEELVTALEASREVQSIYKETDSDSGSEKTILDKIEETKNPENLVLNRIVIKQLLESLEDSEKEIIILRYFQNKTQAEIAKILGTSQVQISRTEKKILNHMKKQMM